MRAQRFGRSIPWAVCLVALGAMVLPSVSDAASAQAIDVSANQILIQFKQNHKGATEALKEAKGYLVFPQIVQAGFIIGGQYGEDALRIHGNSVGFYSIASGSFGLTAGAQSRAVIILFMQTAPLQEFERDARTDKSWQVGLNGSITAVNVGASGEISSAQLNRPIMSFTLDEKGLILNLSLQGSKITKIKR